MVSPQELAGFRDGDSDAVRAVYREFGLLVFAVALRALGSRDLAEEATQQTFVKGMAVYGGPFESAETVAAAVCESLVSDGFDGQLPIRVVVFPATGPDRQPDPVVWFAGGPGDSAVDAISRVRPLLAPQQHQPGPGLHRTARHRGVGHDLPGLPRRVGPGRAQVGRRVMRGRPSP